VGRGYAYGCRTTNQTDNIENDIRETAWRIGGLSLTALEIGLVLFGTALRAYRISNFR